MTRTKTAGRAGFSLIELLIVVSIITLLAAFLLPGLSRAREYAYFTRCKSNLRQIGFGFTIFAGDHDGEFPGALPGWSCIPSSGRCCSANRVGTLQGPGASYIYRCKSNSAVVRRANVLINDVYAVPPGADWEGDASLAGYWAGRPRERGKYLPVEILWDPIVKIRDWAYYDPVVRVGTERNRDRLSRYQHVADQAGSHYGYQFFVGPVGCSKRLTGDMEHVNQVYGGDSTDPRECSYPFRPSTKFNHIKASHKPSAWLAACLVPIEWNGEDHVSHFGNTQAVPGRFRHNVLRLDGSVHDSIWKEVRTGDHWVTTRTGSSGYHDAYGWQWKTDKNYGDEPDPAFGDGAFDCN